MEVTADNCWTGSLAVWVGYAGAAAKEGPASAAAAPSSFASLKTSSSGVWLKSGGGGVLSIVLRPAAPPLLTFTAHGRPLRGQAAAPLLQAPLAPGAFAFSVHCAQHAAAGAAVLFMRLRGRKAASGRAAAEATYTFAVRFDLPPAGRACGALLQASRGVCACPSGPSRTEEQCAESSAVQAIMHGSLGAGSRPSGAGPPKEALRQPAQGQQLQQEQQEQRGDGDADLLAAVRVRHGTAAPCERGAGRAGGLCFSSGGLRCFPLSSCAGWPPPSAGVPPRPRVCGLRLAAGAAVGGAGGGGGGGAARGRSRIGGARQRAAREMTLAAGRVAPALESFCPP